MKRFRFLRNSALLIALLLSPLRAATTPPPNGMPSTISEQEGPFSGTWTWNSNGYYDAQWSNGAVAKMTVQSFTAQSVIINRTDVPGSNGAGLTAVYTGQISSTGNSIVNSQVTWTWPGVAGYPATGTWSANWCQATPVTSVGAGQQTTVCIVLTQLYTDTGIQLTQGQTVTVTASGTMNWYPEGCPVSGACVSSPDGASCPFTGFAFPNLPCWSLIGQIGTSGTPFKVGTSLTFTAPSSGEFYLGVNDTYYPDNTGIWEATVNVAASRGCTQNATVDATKIHVTPNPTNEFYIRSNGQGKVIVTPGANLFLRRFPPFGMNIIVDSDAVSYTGTSAPNITYNFVQILNTWSGNSIYSDDYGQSYDEWFAVSEDENGKHNPPLVDSYNYVPPFPYYPDVLAPFPTFGTTRLFDSPEVSAYLLDLSKRRLVEMHYTKEFTTYFGCHTADDETLPVSDPKHYLRTLAIVKWSVNYSGKVTFSCLGDSFCSFVTFATSSDGGVAVESEQVFAGTDLDEPPTVKPPIANLETRYQWSKP